MSALNLDKIIKKFMLIFLILTVTSAGFCGFFLKWSFRDGDPELGFEVMMEGTAKRPFVHRRLLPEVVQKTAEIIPAPTKEKILSKLENKNQLENLFAQSNIQKNFLLEYYLMFIYCFLIFFASIWVLRSLLTEILQDEVAGTLTAMLFALLFPFFEVVGGYYYDFPEILFMFMAAKFALQKKIIPLLILAPVAEFNKESFFFFLPVLYPLLRKNFDVKKSAGLTLTLVFFAGLTYLYVRQQFLGNPGDSADLQLWGHLDQLFDIGSYFMTASTYGVPLGTRMFFFHVVYVIWIVKNSWKHLDENWKLHAKIALVINGILYALFIAPGELRDLSILYISFMILTGFYIRDILSAHYKKV